MDFASCECLTYGLSGMSISPGYFQFYCSDQLHLCCKALKGQTHAMIACCSSLPFSVFETRYQVLAYNGASTIGEVQKVRNV